VDKIENDDYSSQLRSLRLILGKNFRPISTAALASLTGIDVVSIRGVEAGRRKLNTNDELAIAARLGTIWGRESHQWISVWAKGAPFSRLEYETYSDWLINSDTLIKENSDGVKKAIDCLLANLEAKEAALALILIGHKISEIAEQNNVPAEVLESIAVPLPKFKSLMASLSARDKAIETRNKSLADVEDREKARTHARKKRKAKK
jgi:hypothetical protein